MATAQAPLACAAGPPLSDRLPTVSHLLGRLHRRLMYVRIERICCKDKRWVAQTPGGSLARRTCGEGCGEGTPPRPVDSRFRGNDVSGGGSLARRLCRGRVEGGGRGVVWGWRGVGDAPPPVDSRLRGNDGWGGSLARRPCGRGLGVATEVGGTGREGLQWWGWVGRGVEGWCGVIGAQCGGWGRGFLARRVRSYAGKRNEAHGGC